MPYLFQIAQDFVENILGVHQKYREMIGDTFSGDQAFVGALDKACTAVINHRLPKQQAKAPELVKHFSKFYSFFQILKLENQPKCLYAFS